LLEIDSGIGSSETVSAADTPDLVPDAKLDEAMDAVTAMDPTHLEQILYQAAAGFSRPVLIEKFLAPFLERIGREWHRGAVRVAQEHFASSIVRGFLASLKRNAGVPKTAPVLLVASPAGQEHEFGALFAAVTAETCGWRSLYLGANLPAEEIAGSANSKQVRAVALSIIYPASDPRLVQELEILHRCLDSDTPIIVGGQAAPSYKAALDSIRAVTLRDTNALCSYLEALMQQS
jgi:methanogenic corrinoid protein MtbC1